jgi:ABC-2 type transport system permease protein
MILHMSRKVGEKEQRVVVMGDSDWCTNGEMGTYRQKVNSEPPITIRYNFSYLTQNEYPVYVEEAYGRDNKLFLGLGSVPWIKLFCMGILPLILTITCITIQVKRRRK